MVISTLIGVISNYKYSYPSNNPSYYLNNTKTRLIEPLQIPFKESLKEP